MILKHYIVKSKNTIKDIIYHLTILEEENGNLFVNSAYVDNDNNITLNIDEMQAKDLIELNK